MKKTILVFFIFLAFGTAAGAQKERLNFYINYQGLMAVDDFGGDWSGRYETRHFRLEFTGNVGEHAFYRIRHHLNFVPESARTDNTTGATDFMYVGWRFNESHSVIFGKQGQAWGGFEYDENPLHVYRYCDLVNNMADVFTMGLTYAWRPSVWHELQFQMTNTRGTHHEGFPFTYIVNWNGTMLDGLLYTRWATGLQNVSKGNYSRLVTLGTKLDFGRVQWYVDYYGVRDDVDSHYVVSEDFGRALSNVAYDSFMTKADWQFAPSWNVFFNGSYESTGVSGEDGPGRYRKALGYFAGLEYYPIKGEDMRVFVMYQGKKVDFNAASGLADFTTNRFAAGIMCRIKVF